MPIHDFICDTCDTRRNDAPTTLRNQPCTNKKCKGHFVTSYSSHFRARSQDAAVHKTERTVLLYSAKEGKHQYPATNDQPVPERLRKRGYERVEFPSLRSLEQHGKQTGAISERAWFDKGSGRGMED